MEHQKSVEEQARLRKIQEEMARQKQRKEEEERKRREEDEFRRQVPLDSIDVEADSTASVISKLLFTVSHILLDGPPVSQCVRFVCVLAKTSTKMLLVVKSVEVHHGNNMKIMTRKSNQMKKKTITKWERKLHTSIKN